MKIGCPTEIKPQEFRVGLTPAAAAEAALRGHDVLVQSGAGLGAALAGGMLGGLTLYALPAYYLPLFSLPLGAIALLLTLLFFRGEASDE